MAWISTNRHVRELSCSERALYNLEPGCDNQGTFPTRTPYPTPLPGAMPTPASPVDVALITGTPAATETPTVTPRPVLTAQRGSQRGEVAIGDDQAWEYIGRTGETLTIQVAADQPCNREMQPTSEPASCLDTQVFVRAPDGTPLNLYADLDFTVIQPPESLDIVPGTNTNSRIDDLALPEDGVYRIIVSGTGYQTGGAYTLTIESTPPETNTPTPGP
jgi:hypothetical protein